VPGYLIFRQVFGIATQALAKKRPDIDARVFAYAKTGFGDYVGFLSVRDAVDL
jgi:hypothetical protein